MRKNSNKSGGGGDGDSAESYFLGRETLVELELESLKKILCISWPPELVVIHQGATRALARLEQGVLDVEIRLPVFSPRTPRRDQTLFVGAAISDEISYSLLYCDRIDDGFAATRRLHFDFEAKDRRADEIKPSMHLQAGGALPRFAKGLNVRGDLLDADEKPRIPCLPFSLVSLLDIVFHEYRHLNWFNRVLDNSSWQRLASETTFQLMEVYLSGLSGWHGSAERTSCSLARFLYHV